MRKKSDVVGIYLIRNTKNSKVYVGKFYQCSYEERIRTHKNYLTRNKHYNKKLQNFVNKYGINCLIFESFISGKRNELSEEKVNTLEKLYISSVFNSFKNGYNMATGGEGASGSVKSKKHREEIAENRRNYHKINGISEEYRQNCIKSNINKKRVFADGREFTSAMETSRILGINYNTVIKRIRIKFRDYRYIDATGNLDCNKPIICKIDGVVYRSLAAASRNLGYSMSTISDRIKDDRFKNYVFIGRSDTYENSQTKNLESVTTIQRSV